MDTKGTSVECRFQDVKSRREERVCRIHPCAPADYKKERLGVQYLRHMRSYNRIEGENRMETSFGTRGVEGPRDAVGSEEVERVGIIGVPETTDAG
jgi:hypothetical protein